MAVRQIEPIDRAELRATIQKWIDAHTDVDDTDGVGLLEDVLWEINAQPTLTPPNELLTLDQLREMDGEPVWVELYRAWALVEVKRNGSIMFYGNSFSCPYSRTWRVYRFRPDSRPPEGEEDT